MAIHRTKRRSKQEIADLLTTHYPRVHRVAWGLCGEASAAGRVTRLVLSQSLAVQGRWRSEVEAENWFLHHAILACRSAASSTPLPLPAASPPAAAFFRALAGLPFQQREVMILRQGERLDIRRTAVAMDCSSTAAGNHLAAAERAMKLIAGDDYETLLKEFVAAYRSPPAASDVVIGFREYAGRGRKIWRFLLWIAAGAIAAGGVWYALRW